MNSSDICNHAPALRVLKAAAELHHKLCGPEPADEDERLFRAHCRTRLFRPCCATAMWVQP
jgi:hypothetical protein